VFVFSLFCTTRLVNKVVCVGKVEGGSVLKTAESVQRFDITDRGKVYTPLIEMTVVISPQCFVRTRKAGLLV